MSGAARTVRSGARVGPAGRGSTRDGSEGTVQWWSTGRTEGGDRRRAGGRAGRSAGWTRCPGREIDGPYTRNQLADDLAPPAGDTAPSPGRPRAGNVHPEIGAHDQRSAGGEGGGSDSGRW